VSIEYTFRLVPAEAFARGEPENWTGAATDGRQWFTVLGGADHALHRVFTQLGGPLRFAIAGDHCPHGTYDNPAGPDPVFAAWVTPETAREVAAALARLPRWRVIEVLRALDWNLVQHKAGRDLYSAAYDVVQAAYAAAAKQSAGLSILIC
jgi:hypothetical protein